jgi:hypothetical protein
LSLSHTHTQELFDNVKKEEFKVPDGEGGLAETFFNPEREGWLTKEGGKYKSKHRRWFILKEGMLYYFKQASVSKWVFHAQFEEFMAGKVHASPLYVITKPFKCWIG